MPPLPLVLGFKSCNELGAIAFRCAAIRVNRVVAQDISQRGA
jgi:hypothetical protein